MRPTTIIDGHHKFRVYVRDTEVTVETGGPRRGVQEWLREFREVSVRCHGLCPEFTSEDYGIANRLLTKHSWVRLDQLAEIFWLQYSDPLDEGYPHVLRLFAKAIPNIERRMGGLDA